jgi:pSer/pThr/pTyr-binding forkhead associated (FHA) protein
MSKANVSISLTIDLPSGKTLTQEFTSGEPIMIGSGGSAHVKLDDTDVSSLHCMVKPVDGGMVVLDLGSDDGTEVNGKEITGETKLQDGDTLKIGKTRITLHFGGAMLAPTVPIRKGAQPDDSVEVTAKQPTPEVTLKQDVAPASEELPPARVVQEDKTVRVADPQKMADEAEKKIASEHAKKPDEKKSDAKKPDDKKLETKKPDAKKDLSKADKKPSLAVANDRTEVVRDRTKKSEAPMVKMSNAKNLSPELNTDEKPNDKGHVDVTMTWGGSVMGVARLSGAGVVTIGDAPGNSFQISHASIPAPSFPLVTLSKAGAVVKLGNGMELIVDGSTKSAGDHTLDINQKVIVRVGAVEFVVQYSRRYGAIDLGLFQTLDYLYSKVFALAMILQIGLIAAFLITPTLHDEADDDLMANLTEFSELILTPPEKKKEKKEDLSGKKAAKAKEEEGLFGKKDKPKEDKMASKKGAPTVDKDKREEDRKLAMDALAALGLKGPEGAVSNVFGPGGLGSGINNAIGGLRGASMGDAGGAGGLGSRGVGAGGGGNGLGIGGIGSGSGRGSGGSGGVDLGGRGKGMTRIQPGKVIYKGSLDREEINRVVKRVLSQIKFCYERELAKEPNLEGKLVASWTIAGTGLVSTTSMTENTMGSKPVEACVLRIIQRLRFPQPQGGGEVYVTYPFVFSPG